MTALARAPIAATARSTDAETLTLPSMMMQLLLDATDTQGALSAHRVMLRDGAEAANPHVHTSSSELFYVLGGSVDLLAGDRVLTATEGDLVVIPPGMAHAFGATSGCDGELLVLITPGIERFDYFRYVVRVAQGHVDRRSLIDSQQRYDNHPAQDAIWRAAR